MDSMVVQHLDLYDWGTSRPIYSSLVSGFVQSLSTRGPIISDVNLITAIVDTTVSGTFDPRATDHRLLTQINCGEGSYVERVSQLVSLVVETVGRALHIVRLHVCVDFGCALAGFVICVPRLPKTSHPPDRFPKLDRKNSNGAGKGRRR